MENEKVNGISVLQQLKEKFKAAQAQKPMTQEQLKPSQHLTEEEKERIQEIFNKLRKKLDEQNKPKE